MLTADVLVVRSGSVLDRALRRAEAEANTPGGVVPVAAWNSYVPDCEDRTDPEGGE